MLRSIGEAYRESARIVVALPWLFALPLIAELIQHVIEDRIGLFASLAAMEAQGDHPARMGFGQVKILSLTLLYYWASRWLAFRGGPAGAVIGDRLSARLYAPVVALSIVLAIVQQFGGGILAPFVSDAGLLMTLGLSFFLFSFALDVYLSVWKVGSALGNARLGIAASIRIMHGNFWWSLAFSFLMTMPLMILHYGLNALAAGRSPALLWSILMLDAFVVGYLGLVLATTAFLIARRATERARVPLVARPASPLPV